MKFLSFFAGALAFGSALAMPYPSTESGSQDLVTRAKRTPKWRLPKQPAAGDGKTGVFTDSAGLTHIFYGDHTPVHGSHIQYHEKTYPEHKGKAFSLASGTSKKGEIASNRRKALSKIGSAGAGFDRDEKPLASLSHGAKKTTVMKVPKAESLVEAQMAKLAKSQARKSGGKVVLHDNRSPKTNNGKLLGQLLKKRDLEAILYGRGFADDVKDGFDSVKNKTESGVDSLKNSTLSQEFESKIDDFEKKFSDLLSKVTDDIKEAGDDFVTAIEQITFGSSHQLGSFYQGMHNFDEVEEAQQANGTSLSDDDLAQDQAAIDSYLGGYVNATKAIGETVMSDFFKLAELVNTELGDDDSADDDNTADDTSSVSDLFSVGDWSPFTPDNSTANSTAPPSPTDDGCENKTTGTNSTSANIKRAQVKLW